MDTLKSEEAASEEGIDPPDVEGGEKGIPDQEEEAASFRQLRSSGDPQLRNALAVRYLHLVPMLVRKFHGKGEREDLIQVGYIGLLKAVDQFDPDLAARFQTYATHCITGELRHYLRDRVDVVRKPRWLRGLSRQVAAFIERHLHDKHRLPTIAEISSELNIEEDGVVELLKSKQPTSMDTGPESLQVAVERIKTRRYESFRLPVEDRIVLSESLEKLLEIERKIIYLFFYKDLNQRQIAGQLDLSPKKVSRVMQKGLDRLRAILGQESESEQPGA